MQQPLALARRYRATYADTSDGLPESYWEGIFLINVGWIIVSILDFARRTPLKHLIQPIMLVTFLSLFGMTGVHAASTANNAPAASASENTTANIHSGLKVGVLDLQELLTKSPQAVEAGKKLEKEFQSRKDKLISKQKDFQSKQESFQRNRDVMSESERKKSEKEMERMQKDLQHSEEELRSDITSRHKEETDEFMDTVRNLVAKLAAEEKYDLVLYHETTIYIADRIDITEKMLNLMAKQKGSSKSSEKEKK